MNRNTSAFFAFTWPVAVFLVALGAAVLFAGPACGGDDLADLTARLEAQNAAAKPHDHADPAAKPYYVTHIGFRTTDFWIVSNRDYPTASDSKHYATKEEAQAECDRLNGAAAHDHADPFAAKNGTRATCGCKGDLTLCNCAVKDCACPECLAARKAAGESRCGCGNPGVCSARGCGGTQPCDDESCPRAARAEGTTRPATDGGAGWTWTNAEGGYWWRYAARPVRPTYYAPLRQAFFAPSFGGGCVGGS